MYKIILDIDTGANVYIGNEKIRLCKNCPKILELDTLEEFDFDIVPWTENASFIHFLVAFHGEDCIVKSPHVRVIKVDQKSYYFKICAKNTQNVQKKCKKITKNDLIFNFYQNGVIEIENQNSLIFAEKFEFLIYDAEVMELNGKSYCLKLFGKGEEEKSIIVDSNFQSVLSFDSAVVETTETGFKVLTDLKDIACHGLVEIYEIGEIIEKIDEYSVYLKGAPQNSFNENVLPIYFLQCIRANDFLEAKRCLSGELSNKAKNEHLKAYFGNFIDILTFEEKIYTVYQSPLQSDFSNNYFSKQYRFKIKDGKITEIS